MSYSVKVVKRVVRPAYKLLRSYRRIAERWKVWQIKGELKGLERERGFAYKEGNMIMAQALRNELGELKNQLSADIEPSVKRRHTTGYSAGKGCCENEGGLI
jgi:hypothetical protein